MTRQKAKKIFFFFVVPLLGLGLSMQVIFWFWAEPLLKTPINRFVSQKTDSLYYVDFSQLRINFITRSFELRDFRLIPDSLNPQEKNLLYVSLKDFEIKNVNFLYLLLKRSLTIRSIILDNPQIKLVNYNKKSKNKNSTPVSYQVVKQQILSKILTFTNEISVRELRIRSGKLDFLHKLKEHNFTAQSVTLILHDFHVSKQNLGQKSLFARDFEIVMDKYKIRLNTWHQLESDKLIISSHLKTIRLINTLIHPIKLSDSTPNIFAHIAMISLKGIDFEDIYLNNNLAAKTLNISEPSITIYNIPHQDTSRKKIDLLSLIKNFFHTTAVDSFNLYGASIKLYSSIRSPLPLLEVRDASITARDLKITQNTSSFEKAIGNIKARINSVSTKIIKRSHLLNVRDINFDYKRHSISTGKITILPLPGSRMPSLLNIRLDNIQIKGFDIPTLITKLHLGTVILGKGKITITQLSKPIKKQNNIPSLFIDSLNIDNIRLEQKKLYDKPQTLAGNIHLQGSGLTLGYKANQQNFKFNHINLRLTNFSLLAPENIQFLRFDTLLISSHTKKIQVKGLSIDLNPKADSLLKAKHKSLIYKIYTPALTVDNVDLRQAIFDKKVIVDSLILNNPSINFYSYPEIASDTFNIQIRKLIREKRARELVDIASQTIFDMYQMVSSFTDTTYKDFKHRSVLIDSLESFAIDMIFNIHIPGPKINLQDTTAQNIEQIFTIASYSIRAIAFGHEPDSSFITAIERIDYIRRKSEKKFFNLQEIASTLMNKLNLIQVGAVILDNAALTLTQKFPDKQTTIFKNFITINLTNFQLVPEFSTTCKKRLFCSDNIRVDIKNYSLNLPDSVHTLEFNHLDINTQDSTIILSDVYINADTTCPQARQVPVYINSYIPNIILSNISIHKLIDSNVLDINNILITKSFFHIKVKNKTVNTTTTARGIHSPLKQIIIHNIIAPQNILRLNTPSIEAYTIADFLSTRFRMDSSTNALDLLTNIFARTIFRRTNINIKSGPQIKSQSLYFDTNGKIWSSYLQVNLADSIKLSWDSLYIKHLDLATLLDSHNLEATFLYIKHPYYYSLANTHRAAKPITSIDLYPLLKPYFQSVNIDTSSIDELEINTPSANIDNLSLRIKRLHIDSTTTIDTPSLFYCQNIVVELHDFQRQVSLLYTTGFKDLKADISRQKITLTDFYYKPTVTINEFRKLIEWRRTYTNFSAHSMEIKKINWLQLITKQSIQASVIKIKDFNLYAFIDRGIKHDYSHKKPHFVDLILKSPIPLDINDIILQNGNITYEEKAPDNQKPGHIELNKTYIILTNVKTNLKPPEQIRLHVSGLIQNKDKVSLYGYFNPDTIKYKFRIYGQLGQMDLADLNPFLIYSANLKVKSGHLQKAEFLINGSDSIATGVFKATYHNLVIEVLKPGGEIQPQKRKFLSFAANLIARRNNPQLGVFYKIGYIAYIHDRSFSDIKFWIKALISGAKSLILFENKKELKKIYRLKYGTSVIFYL